MGKPYNHTYYFSGSGCSAGTMVCAKCSQPIFNHNQDWMHYTKSCKDEHGWPDWKYVCFHRKCCDDQLGWVKIEDEISSNKARHEKIMGVLRGVASELGVTCPYEFAELAAESLGQDDLDSHFFYKYGSG